MKLDNFRFKKRTIESWNNTIKNSAIVVYPRNTMELRKLIKFLKENNKKYLIRTGSCSYDSKSINPDLDTIVISLSLFNKILSLNNKKRYVEVEAGALISDVIKKIKKKNVTLFSVPGGEKVSIGGAISANTIGKDSTSKVSSFGDAVTSLETISTDGKIQKISNKKKLSKFVGAFGMEGIILKAKLKLKKMKSQNLLVKTKILKNLSEVMSEFKEKSEYHYVQLDPFFRPDTFGISFKANSIDQQNNYYKSINLKTLNIEKIIFKFFGNFINNVSWRIFYKLFFLFNAKVNKIIDVHNFHYSSKYKHLIPQSCKDGLIDYEILIKKNFYAEMNNLINILKKNKIYPMYVIIKKIFKSKNNYCYQFNQNGFAVAISINKSKVKNENLDEFKNYLFKKKYKINLSKTDEKFIEIKKNGSNLFLSLYKEKLLKQYGISGTRIRSFR
tara:strand:- start:1427 stop:2758 length:1332 start_codon:yes stop_codon:yes gene_type:complete